MVYIVQKNDPVLRLKAKPVTKEMFGTKELGNIIADMKEGIRSQDDAVAIAAPQIGVSLQIFVVSGKVFDMLLNEEGNLVNDQDPVSGTEDKVFINPTITKISREKETMEEGCLSVRYLYGKIKRAKKARVRAQDEKGNVFEIGGSGLLAQIFQHETDHLEGRLFIDTATDIEDIPPEILNKGSKEKGKKTLA